MKKVITYGTWDLFHEGHLKLLRRAKALGDYLIVGVTTEEYDNYRGKMNVVDSLMERVDNVKNTGLADEIIIEYRPGQKVEDIQRYDIDVFVVGSDWVGKFDYLKQYCEVVYLDRTKGISSTLRRQMKHGIVRLGIVGSGRIARRFMAEAKYVSGTNVEGVYNPSLSSAAAFAELFELGWYTDEFETLMDKVDAVYIASPHHTHYDYVKRALECGKHVLCEKPLALQRQQAEEVFALARQKDKVLMEAIKTAYAPGFMQLLGMVKSGRIGEVVDVEACFTKLVPAGVRELDPGQAGGSVTELASYPLLAIVKLLGTDYRECHFETFVNEQGIDLYTKIHLRYKAATATAKVGLGVKSEGQLVASGTTGYLFVEAPWWKTQMFELRYERVEENEKFFARFAGDGLRYELSDFISVINGSTSHYKLKPDESVAIAGIMEAFLAKENVTVIN